MVTYKSSWEEIQNELIKYAGVPKKYSLSQAAYEIKTAIESIEQQKRTTELQEHLLDQQMIMRNLQESIIIQQKEANNIQRKTAKATAILAGFTIVLAVATLFYVFVSLQSLSAFETQTNATEKLASITDRQVHALTDLRKSIQLATKPSLDFKLDRSSGINKLHIENRGLGPAVKILIHGTKSKGSPGISQKKMPVLGKDQTKFVSIVNFNDPMGFVEFKATAWDISRYFYKWRFRATQARMEMIGYEEYEVKDGRLVKMEPMADFE